MRSRPVVLVVGGLDPGGGAGLAADIRAVRDASAFAAPVATVITVQSTGGLARCAPLSPSLVRAQMDEVLGHERVRVVKTGALGSLGIVRAVRSVIEANQLPLVVDPVRMPTRGAQALVSSKGFVALARELFPVATLVTPNIPEAEAILGRRIRDAREARQAARDLSGLGARAVLLKGGHLGGPYVTDTLSLDGALHTFSRRRLALPPLHGGGCFLASLIAGFLAARKSVVTSEALRSAIEKGRAAHHRALRHPINVGGPLAVLA